MSHTVTWIDRLRIERLVWALDQRLYDLPRLSRIAKRREVRENLLAAAKDIGTTAALRRLGGSAQLASEYRSAEFGDGPRHSWIAAMVVAGTAPFILNWILGEAAQAFAAGVRAAQPNATGIFTWPGIPYIQSHVTYTLVNGTGRSVGGAWTPLLWAVWIGSIIVVGRLWRALPMWKRRKIQPAI
ncbi:MAG: hypothetical protein QOE09_1185 [Ilumatobacteraceae bacterium]|jgi:hypothetical protein